MNRFRAFGQVVQQPAPGVIPTVPTSGTKFDLAASVAPLVSGAIMGYVVYRTARSLKVDVPKSRGIALTIGVTTAIGQIANGWFHGWLAKAGVA